jgi:hypothetical protein
MAASLAVLTLAAGLAFYPRAPVAEATRARGALAAARELRAHRLAPEAYRQAELAYVEGARLMGRQRERWIPSYREAETELARCVLLAERAAELAGLRDPERERAALEKDLAALEDSVEALGEEVERLAAEGALGPEEAEEGRALVEALRRRRADVAEAVATGEYPEANTRARTARAQLETARVLLADLMAGVPEG